MEHIDSIVKQLGSQSVTEPTQSELARAVFTLVRYGHMPEHGADIHNHWLTSLLEKWQCGSYQF